jgi:hypothetical protein
VDAWKRGSGVFGVRVTLGEEAHIRAFSPGLGEGGRFPPGLGAGAAHTRDGAIRNLQFAMCNS